MDKVTDKPINVCIEIPFYGTDEQRQKAIDNILRMIQLSVHSQAKIRKDTTDSQWVHEVRDRWQTGW